MSHTLTLRHKWSKNIMSENAKESIRSLVDFLWKVAFLLLLPWLVWLTTQQHNLQLEVLRALNRMNGQLIVIEATSFTNEKALLIWQELATKAPKSELNDLENRVVSLHLNNNSH